MSGPFSSLLVSSLVALIVALLSLAPAPVECWVADTPSGYVISSNVVVNGSVSVVTDDAVVDVYALVRSLQAQLQLQPQLYYFGAGSGVWTAPSNPPALYAKLRMVGGGGGGSGGAFTGLTSVPPNGNLSSGQGGNTSTFGPLFAAGGLGGYFAQSSAAPTPGGGGYRGGQAADSGDFNGYWWFQNGSPGQAGDWYYYVAGQDDSSFELILDGGLGGASFLGGAGSSSETGLWLGQDGGGGGGGCAVVRWWENGYTASGAGGGAGVYLEATIHNPSGSYAYHVGEGGAPGSSGNGDTCSGTWGGGGLIILELYYH